MNVFRIKMNPDGEASLSTTFKYCLDNCLLGVGWQANSLTATKNWEEYEKVAECQHGKDNIRPPRYIKNNVKKDDLVWTRGVGCYGGKYYHARVKSEWEYWHPKKADGIDVANIFRCDDIYEVDVDYVPGKVVASFSGRGNSIQRVCGDHILEYSKHIWNEKSGKGEYDVDGSKFRGDIFKMLDFEETEDILFIYLQSKGWYVIPNSRKGNTMKFEFFVVCPETGERAKTQVKTGETDLNREEYKADGKVFLFQPNELYTGAKLDNVICIARNDILKFIKTSMSWMPGWLQTKSKIVGFA